MRCRVCRVRSMYSLHNATMPTHPLVSLLRAPFRIPDSAETRGRRTHYCAQPRAQRRRFFDALLTPTPIFSAQPAHKSKSHVSHE